MVSVSIELKFPRIYPNTVYSILACVQISFEHSFEPSCWNSVHQRDMPIIRSAHNTKWTVPITIIIHILSTIHAPK